jgi:hypothetical protein
MKHSKWIGLGSVLVALCVAGAAGAATRHTMSLKLWEPATVKGTSLAPGEYKLSWTATGSEADITIEQRGKVVATSKANVVERDKAIADDMVVFQKGGDGSQVLSEVRTRGEKAVLVVPAS